VKRFTPRYFPEIVYSLSPTNKARRTGSHGSQYASTPTPWVTLPFLVLDWALGSQPLIFVPAVVAQLAEVGWLSWSVVAAGTRRPVV